jgi:hypothetical protein
MTMIARYDELVEQRFAALRRPESLRPTRTREPAAPTRSVRAGLGRALVRLGERLAAPAGAAATP